VAYVLADTADKSLKEYRSSNSNLTSSIKVGGDVVIWQMLASVMIPGFTINRICWFTSKALKAAKFKHKMAKWIPTVIGLCSIPLIIHPIDSAVDVLMDKTYRKYV
jgi:mitochondrial fission process protein 1